MAAKGSIAKEAITNQILSTFPGSFIYGKEIRIPYSENGAIVQIKVALTCAKENVEVGADVAVPGESVQTATAASNAIPEISAEEQGEVNELIAKLGL